MAAVSMKFANFCYLMVNMGLIFVTVIAFYLPTYLGQGTAKSSRYVPACLPHNLKDLVCLL